MFWNILLGIASFALNLLLSPKPQSKKPSSLEDFGIPVAEEGLEIPVAFGSVWQKSPNTVWYGDLQLQPIKGPRRYGFFGPKSTVGWKYGLGLHMILSHSTPDKIWQIWAEKQLFPKLPSTAPFEDINGILVIDQMDIYGGEEAGGGVFGPVAVLGGAAGQTVDGYLAEQLGTGANTPAFRGVFSLVWQTLYIGTSPYLKPWEIYFQRIHRTATGAEQWYDAKAAVPDSFTDTGSDGATLASGIPMNSEMKIDTNGEYAVRVDGRIINVFHLPNGEETVIESPPSVGPDYEFGFAGSAHITDYGELMVRNGGNWWGGIPTYLEFRDISDPVTLTQGQIDLHPIVNGYGPDLASSGGFVSAERQGKILLRLEPVYFANTLPWILLDRSGDEWNVSATLAGVYPISTLSVGPTYGYGISSGSNVVRFEWSSMSGETLVDLSIPLSGATVTSIHYFEGTGEVIVLVAGTVHVFSDDLSTLLRSRSISGIGTVVDSRRMSASASTIMLFAQTGGDHILYEIQVSDLTTKRTTDVEADGFVHSDVNYDYMLYNQDMGGVVMGAHASYMTYWPYTQDAPNMNPSHIIRECLTDRTWGMGYADADIDDDSFMAAADTLYTECFGLGILWTREQPLDEFISMILSHIDGYLYLRRDTGKFFLKLIRNDYVVDDLPIFTEADVENWDEVVHRGPAEAINTVTVKWTDKSNRGKDSANSYDNIAQIQQIGARVPATRFYPGITYGPLAARVARRDQRTLGIGIISGRLTGHRTFDTLYPGDPFRLVSERHGLEGEVMRVTEMKFGDGRENAISVKFVQDVFRMYLEDILDTSGSDWEDPTDSDPEPVAPRMVWEAPYYEFSQLMGPSTATTLLADDPDVGVVEVAGSQPSATSLQADIYIDSVDTAETLGLWSPSGLLDADLGGGPTDDTITIEEDVDADNIEVGMLAALVDPADPTDPTTTEVVRIVAISTLTLTIERGLLDTVPMEHPAGTWLVVFHDFVATDGNPRTAGDTPIVELRTKTTSSLLSASLAPDDEITFASRAIRPLRPADIQVDGSDEGPLDLTGVNPIPTAWARRNRLSETTPLAWDDADVSPESGQTTIIRLLDAGGALIDDTTYAGIAGTTQDIDTADFGGATSGILEFGSQRDGYDSWQAYRVAIMLSTDALLLEGDMTDGDDVLLLEGDESGQLLIEGST